MKNLDLPVYTLDIETDPFEEGVEVWPFCMGLWNGEKFTYTWGPDCVAEMLVIVRGLKPGILYMHNGGGFDFFFMMDWFVGTPLIKGARIVRAAVETNQHAKNGSVLCHDVRDSFAIMPFALAQFDKDDIDYMKMKKEVREKHKREILKYLKKDCTSLYKLCTTFREAFGDHITIGMTAMAELKKLHSFETYTKALDHEIRSDYYYGGRVQVFKYGITKGNFKIYDVNSMYPSVMKNYMHPIGWPSSETTEITKDTCFLTVTGENLGAFPRREKKRGLRFDGKYGTYHVSIHEWNAAIECDLFRPHKIERCINYSNRSTFAEFVDTFYNARKTAKASGDSIMALFYKYVLNSAYGKFGQNPENFFAHKITDLTCLSEAGSDTCPDCAEDCCGRHWMLHLINEQHNLMIWRKKRNDPRWGGYHNIATGASITGAARSLLVRAISQSRNPIYCDTDSLVCEELVGVKIDNDELGAWKYEGEVDECAIAGKKLYAMFKDGELVKMACKGARITPDEIRHISEDEDRSVLYKRISPTMKMSGDQQFITRRIRMVR